MRKLIIFFSLFGIIFTFAKNAGAAVIFDDRFTQTSDTTLASHTPTNAGASWSVLIQNGGGTMRADASSDDCRLNTGGFNDGVLYQANVTGGYQNVDYEASVIETNGDTGDDWSWIAVRAIDANNLYVFRFNNNSGQLYKRTTGTYSTLGAATAGIADGSTVLFRVIGTNLEVFDDGVSIRSVADSDHAAAGTACLGMGDISVTSSDDMSAQLFDTFSVTTYVRITGTVYSDEGTTAVGAGVNVSVSINGAAAALTDATDASGVYDLRGLTVAAGDVLTVYVDDNTAGNEAAVVTVSDGQDHNFDLYYNYLKVRQDNAGSLTNVNLATSDNNGDSDITGLYTVPGNVLTMASGKELFIDSGNTYAPGNNVDANTIDINGVFTVAANVVNVSGDWDATGGSFSFTTGDVIFDGDATTQNVTSNGSSFFDVQIGTGAVGAVVATASAMDINGALTVLNGGATTFNISDDTVNAAGAVTLTNLDTFTVTNSTFVFDGTTTLTSATRAFNNVQIGSATAGGTLTTADTMDINGTVTVLNGGATTWDVTSDTINVASTVNLTNLDTFTVTGSTFVFDGTSTLTSATRVFNNVQLGTGAVGGSLTTADNMEVNGNMTILNGGATTWDVTSDTITIATSLDLTNLDTFTVTGSTFVFDGTTTLTSDTLAFNNIQIGTASVGASLTTADAMDINGAVTVLNGGATTWDVANDTISAAGSVNLTNLDTFTVTASTFIFDGTTTLTSATRAFNNIQIGTASVGGSLTTADNMDINGTVTVLNGAATTWDVTSDTISVASTVNLTNLDTFTVASSTFIFDGTTTLTSAGRAFNAVQIGTGAVGGSLTTADAMDINGALTILNGGATTFNISDDTVNAAGTVTLTNLDTFTVTNSTFVFDGTTTLTSAGLAFNAVDIGSATAGATLTTADNMDINGALMVNNGGATTWDVSNDTISVAGSADLSRLDTFTVASSTFVFDGTTTLTSPALAFNNIQIGTGAVGGSLTTANNMDINGTVTVLNGGATTWDVAGDTINAASTVTLTNLDTFTVTTSTFVFDGTTTLTSAALAFNNVQIGSASAGGTLTTADNMDINGTVTVLNGGATTWDVTTDTINVASTVNLTNLDTFTVTGSTFVFDGTSTLTSNAFAFNNVQLGTGAVGGSLTTADNMEVNGNMTILNGGATTWDVTSDTITIASNLDLTNLDTFTVTTSTFVFDGTTTLTSDTLAFNNIQIGTAALGGALTTADNMDINGNVTVLNGGATTWDVTNDTVNAAGSVNLTNLDTFTATGSTFIFDGTTTLTSAGFAFNTVQIGTGAIGASVTTADNMEINGNITILNGGATTWDVTSDTITIATSLDLTNLDTFTVTGSTFVFDGTTTLTSDTLAFNNIQIGTGAIGASLTTADAMDINGNVTVLNGGATTWDVANDSISAAGNVDLTNLDTLTVTASTFIFDGTTSLTSATRAFNNIQIGTASVGGSLTTADNMDINGTVTVLNGGATTWNIANDTINAASTVTLTNLDTFTVTSSTFIFDGTTTLTSAGLAFNAVQIGTASVGASLTTADNMDINGAVSVLNGGATTWDVTSDTISVASTLNLTNLDTFTVTGSTFVFDGTTTLTSATRTFNNVQIGSASAAGSLTTADNMDINGTVTVQNGGATTWDVTSDTINVASTVTLTNLDTFTTTGSTFIFDGTTTLTSAGLAFNTIQIGTGAIGASVTTADAMDINGALTVLNGGATTFNISDDTISASNNITLTNLDTFTVTNSTFVFDGTTSLTSANLAFNNIQIGSATAGGSLTPADNMDINGSVTVQNGGATTWNITSRRINIAGSVNLTNLDTLTVTGSTVIMDGTGAANVTSAGLSFNHFMINDGLVGYWRMDEANDNDTVIDYSGYGYNGTANSFAAGGGPVTNVSGSINFTDPRSLDFDGTDDYVQTTSNDLQTLNEFTIALWFRADATNFARMLLWQGDVAGNGYGAQQEMSISMGNISGGSLGDRIAFNLGNTDNDLNANILNVETAFTDTTNWHHVAVTVSTMSTAPACELFLDGVSVDTDTGTTAVTPRTSWNTNLRFGRPGAAQRFYDGLLDEVRVYNRVLSDPEILLLAQGTHPATFLGTNTLQDNLDVNGTLSINAGALNAGTNRSITVAGNWMNNGGVFTEQEGFVTMDGTSGTRYILAGAQTFYNLRVDDGDGGGNLAVEVQQDLDVDGTLTLPDGGLDITTILYGIRMGGNWINSGGTFTPRTGTVIFEGTLSDQTITSNTQAFYNILINNTAVAGNDDIILTDNMDINGTMTLTDGDLDANTNDVTINVQGNWLASSPGTFDEGFSTVIFDAPSGSAVITMPADTFYNVNINSAAPGTATFVVQGTLDINGKFQVDEGTFDLATNDPLMFVEGNFILNSGTFNTGTSTIAFDGDKIFFDGIFTNVGTILIDPTTTLTSDMICTTVFIDVGDTLVTDGYEIDCSTNMRVDGTLNAESGTDGNSTINIGRHWRSHLGLLMMDGSTVIMDDNNGTDDLRPGNSNSFYNLTLDDSNGGGDTTWVLLSDLNVDGTLRVLDGTLDVNVSQNRPIFVSGSWEVNAAGVFTARTATVTFNGSGAQTVTMVDDNFYDVIVTNGSSSTVAFVGGTTFNNFTSTVANAAMTFESGETFTISDTLDMNGQAVGTRIVIDSSDGSSRFTFDVTGGLQTVSYVEVSNSQASSNDIRAQNSLNNGNTDTLESSPRWIFGPLRGAVLVID